MDRSLCLCVKRAKRKCATAVQGVEEQNNGKSRLEFFLLFFCEMAIKVSHICSSKTGSGGKRG